ncbi:hypothetical protein GS597_18195 [Synechococcales cyanobacterium C]|uniref:Uncharacterized protein n=1 Tax=Petrachloros mirabilis ULC683 TaxID=2781853 RepID=A0A8K2A0U8_9CYAN|nr:hypothetical protein [Petrachloros mirabilis]NCJ08403.1 hypothetical protein [Petrachloros mirabilis ULC683]
MNASQYYALRATTSGNYLIAHPSGNRSGGYLLLFSENFDALSYLNSHSPELKSHFTVELVPQTQLSSILQRWQFQGIGLVQDPLIPTIQFLAAESA